MATEKLTAHCWGLWSFYVNDVDKTDSIRNLTPNWQYCFSENPDELHGTHISGLAGFIGTDAAQMDIRILWSDTTHAGPFLAIDTSIIWDFNYDKLCEDDEIWITTNYNGKKYESHFVEW